MWSGARNNAWIKLSNNGYPDPMRIPPAMKKRPTLIVLALGALATGFFAVDDDDFFALRKSFRIFGSVYEELVTGYVDRPDPERLMRVGIHAMLEDLDPYTTFIDEADNTQIHIITRGSYGGVGLSIDVRNEKIIVVEPIEGTSGYKQGVRTGDVIVEIEGQSTDGMTISDLRNLMRGEPGTAVELTVEREGTPEPIRFLLSRQQVTLKNVSFTGFADSLTGIGYIKFDRFARGAASEFREAVETLQKTERLQGLVIDLRDNPGGLLDEAVEGTQLFVPQGSVIVSTRGRTLQNERIYRSATPPIAPDLPLVVLVGEITASAAEIMSGALQDLDRAVVLGTPTFGKGLVQVIKPLPYNTSLKMTTSKYYTPSGRSIQSVDYNENQKQGAETTTADSLQRQFATRNGRPVSNGRGVEPDRMASLETESELEKALVRRAAFFFYANHFAARNDSIPPGFTVSDDILTDFAAWLEEEEFTYRTDAEHALQTLDDQLTENGYESAQDEMEALREAMLAEKRTAFERNKDNLKKQLQEEILARYFGQSAQIASSFEHDAQILAAVDLLEDLPAYRQILAPR